MALSETLGGRQSSFVTMDVVGYDAEVGRRQGQAPRVGQRATDIVEPALPMRAHGMAFMPAPMMTSRRCMVGIPLLVRWRFHSNGCSVLRRGRQSLRACRVTGKRSGALAPFGIVRPFRLG